MIKRMILLIASMTAINGFAQTNRLDERIDALSDRLISSRQATAVSVLLIKNGKTIYNKAFGYADVQTGQTLKTDNIFRIASQTKAITSVAVMMLWEEGKILLDDPISKYIPQFKSPKVLAKFNPADSSYTSVSAEREITIRDLLRHTSGISFSVLSADDRIRAIHSKADIATGIGSGGSLKNQIERLAIQPLLHQPGSTFTYGLNHDVLGYLVEIISGMSLDDFFRKRLFVPLDMNDTYFKIPKEKANRLVSLYEKREGDFVKVDHPIYEGNKAEYPIEDGIYFSGGAGLSSTTSDYAKFLHMLLNGGKYNGKQLLSKNTVELMLTNQLTDQIKKADGFQFGLGVALITKDNKFTSPLSVGSFYWGGIYNTYYWVDPKKNIIGLAYTQEYGGYSEDIGHQIKNVVYANIDSL